MAHRAREKLTAGEEPTTREAAALRRVEKVEATAYLDRQLRAVPKGLYCEMAGRSHHVCNQQAKRHGLPLKGATLDLFEVIRSFHDLLAENKVRLSRSKPEADWRELEREEAFRIKRLDRLERERAVLPREEVRAVHQTLVRQLRSLGERLETRFGAEARGMLNDALELMRREIEVADE